MKALFVNASPRKNWNTHKMLESDVIVAGTPIYFSYPTGMFRSFIERLLFPIMRYNVNPYGTRPRAIDRTIYSGIIRAMTQACSASR